MARDAGAAHVTFASCSPPIIHPHIYGIDLARKNDLIAFHKSPEEVAAAIGADALVYQTLPDLVDAILESSNTHSVEGLEVGVFNGRYITPVDDGYLEHLEQVRGDQTKLKRQESMRQRMINGVGHGSNQNLGSSRGDRDSAMDQPDETQDIALHNINDHEGER